MTASRVLGALGPGGLYHPSLQVEVTTVTGEVVASLGQVPALYVRSTVDALRSAKPLSERQRFRALEAAAQLFAEGEVDGISVEQHEYAVADVSGVPLAAVRAATRALADTLRSSERLTAAARPVAVAEGWRDGAFGGEAVWKPRGRVLGVQAPGNHPGSHGPWLNALALGYHVAVRPSIRDPFTPARLVATLRACGFGPDQVAYLPCTHDVAADLVEASDLAVVYGGPELERRYGGRSDVLLQGPGRSKILVATADWQSQLAVLTDSVTGYGGTACVNTTAILVDGDHLAVATAIADQLSGLPNHAPRDDRAVLPVFATERAKEIEEYLKPRLRWARLVSDGPWSHELPGGSSVLRPAVIVLDNAEDSRLGLEMPFPCVWIAPWSPATGLAPLRNSLVVTALTTDQELIEALIGEPTVANVHIGAHPTYLMDPVLPHDGYLAEFLMRSKAVIGALEDGGIRNAP